MNITRCIAAACFAIALASAPQAFAHHSFAVFFGVEKEVEVTGAVTEFAFSNPHGVIVVMAKGADGKPETWKAETNSPSVLRKRGWSKESLKVGDVVTLTGWPAKDGSKYMRMKQVLKDGKPVGVPFKALSTN